MENASKALYMAAGILVAMMIIGIFIYVFRAGAQVGEKYEEKQGKEQLELFNSKFVFFQRDNNTISDMLSVTNLARNVNENEEFNEQNGVSIDIEIKNSIYFSISNKYPIEKNYLYIGKSEEIDSSDENKIYAYDLMHLAIKSLKDCNKNLLNIQNPINPSSGDNQFFFEDEDSFSTIKSKNIGETIYKFYFKCTDLQYHSDTGKISYMKFVLIKNKDYDPEEPS